MRVGYDGGGGGTRNPVVTPAMMLLMALVVMKFRVEVAPIWGRSVCGGTPGGLEGACPGRGGCPVGRYCSVYCIV